MALDSMAYSPEYAIGFFLVMMFIFFFAIAVYVYMALAMMATAKKLNTEQPWLAWIPIANVFLFAKMAKKAYWPIYVFLSGIVIYIALIFIDILYIVVSNPNAISETMNYTNRSVFFFVAIAISYITGILFLTYSTKWLMVICERLRKPKEWAIIIFVLAIVYYFFNLLYIFDLAATLASIFSVIVAVIMFIWSTIVWGILAWDNTAVESDKVESNKVKTHKIEIRKNAKKHSVKK